MLVDIGREISKVGNGNGDVSLLRSRFLDVMQRECYVTSQKTAAQETTRM